MELNCFLLVEMGFVCIASLGSALEGAGGPASLPSLHLPQAHTHSPAPTSHGPRGYKNEQADYGLCPLVSSQVGKTSRRPDLANKNPGHPVRFEFQINKFLKYILNIAWDIFILKRYPLFIWNSHFTGHPVFCPAAPKTGRVISLEMGQHEPGGIPEEGPNLALGVAGKASWRRQGLSQEGKGKEEFAEGLEVTMGQGRCSEQTDPMQSLGGRGMGEVEELRGGRDGLSMEDGEHHN